MPGGADPEGEVDPLPPRLRLALAGAPQAASAFGDDWEAPDVLRNGQLERALGTLRFEEREALFLAAVEAYTAEEIGELTSRPRGTVLSLLHRANAKLRTLLERADEVRR